MKRIFISVLLVVLITTSGCLGTSSGTSNEVPTAYIDSISPSQASSGETVTLTGHGTDPDGSVVAYRWRSSIDGDIGTAASSQTSSLSAGTHTIYLKVQDNSGDWSAEVSATLEISGGAAPVGDADLIITDVYKVEVPAGYIIGYTIKNLGPDDAGECTTKLYANGEEKTTDIVHELAADEVVERQFTGWTFDPVTPQVTVVADANNEVGENNETNNEMDADIEVDLIYDFVSRAGYADWTSGAPSAVLTFPGYTTDNQGFVIYRTETLEDGTSPGKVLESFPKWITDGYVQGNYNELYTYKGGHTVAAGEHFYARFGFLEGATTGDVKFRIMIRPEGEPDIWIATVSKTYDGSLRTINIPLDEYVDKNCSFALKVEANGDYTDDEAVWIEAKLIR